MHRPLLLALLAVATGCTPSRDGQSAANSSVARVDSSTASTTGADSSAVRFVAAFYGAYWARGAASGLAAADSLLAEQPGLFTPTLLAALRRDAAARAAKGDIDGLDFEPFLNSQDSCERFEVGKAARAGLGERVAVYAVCAGKRSEQASVVAEVVPAGRSWLFANFLYGAPSGDLLHVLAVLDAQRPVVASR